ncbi:uncharacterized protein JCM10292_005434 [Rhodotorula paludigena]|uniref:uncharacterized protein n=1 Tax=Rhodotorula paludigena TaxID=86838 RepID=UPI00317F561D
MLWHEQIYLHPEAPARMRRLVQLAEDLVTAPVVDNPVATACLAAIFIRISSLPSAAPLDTILPALVEALCVTLEEILAGADSPSLASEQSTRLSRPHSLLATVHARLTRLIGSYGVDTHLATLALSAPQLSSTGGAESGLGSEMGARTVEEGVLGLWERVGALLDAAR